MTTTPTPSATAQNLSSAIDSYSADARTLYDDSHQNALRRPSTVPANATEAQKAAIEADNAIIKAAQGEHAGAFQQLVTAASMESDQVGRAGYAAVVKLMQATADAADKVCTKLVGVLHAEPGDGVLPASTDYQLIGLMTDAVRALAELSPSQVWVGGTTPGGAG